MVEKKDKRLRQPIVTVLGHVDHGKTTLLDKIRGTAVAMKEAGGITQHVGASMVPASVIEKIAEPLKNIIPIKLKIPGLLFIDTPGHELFSNLRKRGGSVADFAILVVDIMEGFKDQTYEAIDILKQRRVPFIIAANKIDRIPGWKSYPDSPFIQSYKMQTDEVKSILETRIYELMGQMYDLGLPADLFLKIKDFTKTFAIVPVSARTGEGIPELLTVLAGLIQQYLANKLVYAEGPAKGVVLEVKEEPGLGTTLDVIIYDGILRKGDIIVTGGVNGPVVTRVKALLMPKPLQEIRSHEGKFMYVDEVAAAAGVKIAAPDLEGVLAGAPLYVAKNSEDAEKLSKAVMKDVESVLVKTDKEGVIVKADTLGTLEALTFALKKQGISVRAADIGNVTRNDVIDASITKKHDKYLGVILAFNVKVTPEAEEEAKLRKIPIFVDTVIYRLLESYEEWVKKEKERERLEKLNSMVLPGKIRVLPGHVFRRSDPIIVGVEVLGGKIRPGYKLIREDGRVIGEISGIRDRDTSLDEATMGMAVAISIKGKSMVGRHVFEGDVLYTDVPLDHAREIIDKYHSDLSMDELMILREILEIKKGEGPVYRLLIRKLDKMIEKK
ncbi:MAG: translation initiation factor IF-2 [Desulfurococcales archaeon]|nr:translation initiation factor IF-2 [Desulfurococcales archaeon]MEB3787024.1 translation initiation factor IF-2 [Desulfurococcales archaeon]MEB3799026.1 translation initiation factor IF-2 [Desulfurococcales archaeon]MEB3845522.1 translation initiation factor IF-2 [Desulfurococcales archaeon]